MKKFFFTTLIFCFFLLSGTHSTFADDDESIHELQKNRDQARQKIEKIQSALPAFTPGSIATGDDIERWKNKIFALFNDRQFQNSLRQIIYHPSRTYVLGTQLVVLLFMIFFRAWRMAQAGNFLGKMWVGFYCFFLKWGLILIVIPLAMLGEPYKIFLLTIKDTLFG